MNGLSIKNLANLEALYFTPLCKLYYLKRGPKAQIIATSLSKDICIFSYFP